MTILKTLTALLLLALSFWSEALLASPARIVPLELLFAPFFKGPSFIRTNSHGAQFAGRTTISSGSATQVVSTTNVKSDSIIWTGIQAALPAAYTTKGQAAIASGAGSVTASTTAIYSGMNVLLTLEGLTSQLSGYPRGLRINSIVNGVSMLIATVDSLQLQGVTDNVAQWSIPEAMPEGIKINTIVDGGYFILGWADGRARPVDVTVMWEVKSPS